MKTPTANSAKMSTSACWIDKQVNSLKSRLYEIKIPAYVFIVLKIPIFCLCLSVIHMTSCTESPLSVEDKNPLSPADLEQEKSITVNGFLKDSEGYPVEGASVNVTSAGAATLSDSTGFFTLQFDFVTSSESDSSSATELSLTVSHRYFDSLDTSAEIQDDTLTMVLQPAEGEYGFAWKFLRNNLLDQEKLPSSPWRYESPEMLYSTIGDFYTSYTTPQGAKPFIGGGESGTAGLGVSLDSVEQGYRIDDVFAQSPAERAGLLKNDIILSVDEEPVVQRSSSDVQALLEGQTGDEKVLSIHRDAQRLEVNVIIGTFSEPSVKIDSLAADLALIQITHFASETADLSTSQELSMALDQTAWAEGLVLDIRNCPGGDITAVLSSIALFVTDDNEVFRVRKHRYDLATERATTVDTSWAVEGTGDGADRNIILLVNEYTASGAEMFVSGLTQIRADIPLIGCQTYGKATMQVISITPDSGIVRVTFAKIMDTDGNSWDEQGITPDIITVPGEDAFLRAVKVAGQQ